MNYAALTKMVAEDAALRRRQRLQPVGGKGDKIFPPTYPPSDEEKRRDRKAPPRHVFERRRLEGRDGRESREVWCVLVDSVQSQANRLEESLLGIIREKSLFIPHVVVDFSNEGLAGIGKITSLDAPHRIYDAIFRDSELNGQPFLDKNGTLGRRLKEASNTDASALLEVSPTALLFGAWDSTGQGGGLGAKFARCLVSEIVAIDVPVNLKRAEGRELPFVVASGDNLLTVEPVSAGRRTGSRIDPLGILSRKGMEVYKSTTGWDVTAAGAGKNAKQVLPSKVNHSNIPPTIEPLGITCDYLEHMFVLSFAALRRLHFGSTEPGKNSAGRTLLAALGLLAMTEQDAQGYALRSRCDLVCEEKKSLEAVHADGTTVDISADRQAVRSLYAEAFKAAKDAGFQFSDEPIRLTPQKKLVEIVRKSQELALAGIGGEESDTGDGETKEKQ